MRICTELPVVTLLALLAASALAATGVEEFQLEEKIGAPKISDAWLHVAETSAAVYWRTDVPAETYVEYGETADYGRKTAPAGKSPCSGKPFFSHLHRLTGLEAGKTYHYRAVSESGGKVTRGEGRTLTTKKIAGAIRVPGEMKGPPYVLDREGATYVLTRDVTASGLAIDVISGGVTLDLDGHTVVYNEDRVDGFNQRSFNEHIRSGAFGVRIRGPRSRVRVLNGTIRQGAAAQEGHDVSIGFNPVYCTGTPGFELAGVTCEYAGRQVSGVVLHWGGEKADIHHNVIHDKGKLIANRHKTVSALKGLSKGSKAHHNLVRRSRQCGIMASEGVDLHANEVHIDSYSINSFAFGMKHGSKCYDNKVFGCGSNCVAFGTTGGCDGVDVHHNYVRLYGSDIRARWDDLNKKAMESTEKSVMSGPRVTWGCRDVDYHDNVIVVTGSGGSMIRGTFFYSEKKAEGVKFRRNVVAAIAVDDQTTHSGAIATVGNHKPDAAPVRYEDNLIISNFANVNLADSYGTGMNCRFARNTFRKVGDRPGYATIRKLRGYGSTGHVFIDSKFEGGAGYDAISIQGPDQLSVGWTVTIRTEPGAAVRIKDFTGKEAFRGTAAPDGTVKAELLQYSRSGIVKTKLTPHTVVVEKLGKQSTGKVVADAVKEAEIAF